MRHSRLFVATVLAALLAGCRPDGGCGGEYCGTLVIAAPGEPDVLLPPLTQSAMGRDVGDQLFLKLADVGMSVNTIGDADFTPQLAHRWAWEDPLTLRFDLDPRARWHDGERVTASDVAFTFEIYTDSIVSSPSRSLLREIASVRARDSLTVVFQFRRRYAEMFYDAVYHMRILPEHLLRSLPRPGWKDAPFGRQPVGSGPYRFVSWKAAESVELAADSTFFLGRPHLRRLIWRSTPNLQVAVTQVIAGEADAIEVLGPPENVQRVKGSAELTTHPYRGAVYGYLGFNLRANGDSTAPHPVFGNRLTRQALVRALDRQAMLANVWGDLAELPPGPVPRMWWIWDEAPPAVPYDSAQAARVLSRGGGAVSFRLLVPTTSGLRRQYARLIQEQLRKFRVDVQIDEVDFSVMQERTAGGKFDAVIQAWTTGPSPFGTLQNWTRQGFGGTNFGRYDNPQVDRLIQTASQAGTRADAARAWRGALELLNADAPAAFLYAPDNVAAINRRVRDVAIRPDSWLALVRTWRIPAEQLNDRDRVDAR